MALLVPSTPLIYRNFRSVYAGYGLDNRTRTLL